MTNPFKDIPVRHDMQTFAFYNVENLFDLKTENTQMILIFYPLLIKNGLPNVMITNYKN